MVIRNFLTLLFTTFIIAGFAQSGNIKGRVYDAATNEPLPFSNLIIFETQIGSTSDLDGNFTFTGIEPGFVKIKNYFRRIQSPHHGGNYGYSQQNRLHRYSDGKNFH